MPASRSRAPTSSSPPLPFELRPSSIQGLGAFATRRIRKGTRIVEYTGERISQEEADARYDDASMGRHHTFLFNVDEHTVVDGAHGGNESRFINHSCAPNCQAFIEEDDRIFIYALRDISPGEELVYDYGYERTEDMDEEDERLYVCRCGAPRCRGTILAPPQPPEQPQAANAASTRESTRKKKKSTGSKRTSSRKRGPGKGRGGRTSAASLA